MRHSIDNGVESTAAKILLELGASNVPDEKVQRLRSLLWDFREEQLHGRPAKPFSLSNVGYCRCSPVGLEPCSYCNGDHDPDPEEDV